MMNSKVICVNDFPEVAFPPGIPDGVVEKQRTILQAKCDLERFGHQRKRHVHIQTVIWYGEGDDE